MPRVLIWLAAVLASIAPVAAAPARAQDRRALVIGIDSYRELAALAKARADAEAVGSELARLGFSVDLVLDADRRSLNKAISDFLGKIAPGATAYVHFSGHGVEIDNDSYLLPADTPLPRAGDKEFVKREGVRLSELIDSLKGAAAKARILVIDACRDNPFAAKGTRAIGATRGIAVLPAPAGTLIMYSAGTGQTALDRLGEGDVEATSVYTRVLLKHLATPARSLVTIARDVRREVEQLAASVGHEQHPAYYDELSDDFFLAGGGAEPLPPPRPPPVPLPPAVVLKPQTAVAAPGASLPKPSLAPTAPNSYRVPYDVADGYLNLRAGPGTNHPALARIPAGTGALVLGRCSAPSDGGARPWCWVNWQGISGGCRPAAS